MASDIYYGTSGPRDAKIVIVGEAWGAEEDRLKQPFVGTSGTELNRMLADAGIQRADVLCTNVVPSRPQANEMWRYFMPRTAPDSALVGRLHPSTLVREGVQRLYSLIAAHPRAVVIAAGSYALWALTRCNGVEVVSESNNRPIPEELRPYGPTGIQSWRGSMWYIEPYSTLTAGVDQERALRATRLLPIVHPAAVMRQWEMRSSTVHDLKTRVEMALRGDWRQNPAPTIWHRPTYDQVVGRLRLWLSQADRGTQLWLSEDIETKAGFITCVGFADSRNFALVIPFIRPTASGVPLWDSWWTQYQEAQIIHLLRRVNHHPNIHIIGQNFLYDTQYIQHWWGVTPHLTHDTMLVQNVLFPGTPKDLGYLASLYCEYYWYWKEDAKEWDDRHSGFDDLLLYNGWDVLRTWEIAESQRTLLKHTDLEPRAARKHYVNGLCLRMMNRGVRIDTRRRGELKLDLADVAAQLERELLEIIPQDWIKPVKKRTDKFWYRSTKQKAFLFYDFLGFKEVRTRKTGRPTVGKEALDQLQKWYPAFTGLFRRLDQYGSVENTIGVLSSDLDADGRMRCSFNPGGTETHRLSSSKNVFGRGTNLQNLTKGEED